MFHGLMVWTLWSWGWAVPRLRGLVWLAAHCLWERWQVW